MNFSKDIKPISFINVSMLNLMAAQYLCVLKFEMYNGQLNFSMFIPDPVMHLHGEIWDKSGKLPTPSHCSLRIH